MKVEFDINKQISLPLKLVTKIIEGYHIVFAPEYPNWIVLNKDEYRLFQLFGRNTIIDALHEYNNQYGGAEDEILKIAHTLLFKIEKAQFYSYSEIKSEDSIESITKSIHIDTTNDCNLRCKHCYLSAGAGSITELDFYKLKSFLEKLYAKIGKTEVVVSGGEPLIYKNIYALLDYLHSCGHNVVLFTNGTLVDETNIERLKRSVNEIQISMEGITQSNYEKIRGAGYYPALLRSIELIKKAGIKLTLAVTALAEVIDDIEDELFGFLDKLNMENITVRINDDVENKGNAKFLDKSNFSVNHAKKIRICKIMNGLAQNGYAIDSATLRNIHFSNCGIGACIVIDYNGNIYPCSFYEKVYFTINDDVESIINTFNELNKSTGVEKMEICSDCELKFLCCGGCRIKNLLRCGSYTVPCCTEDMKEKKYIKLLEDYFQNSEG